MHLNKTPYVKSMLLNQLRGITHTFSARYAENPFTAGGNFIPVYAVEQVHCASVCILDSETKKKLHSMPDWPKEAESYTLPGKHDGIITTLPETAIGIRTADCIPVLIAYPGGPVGAFHCGWRGLVRGILLRAAQLFAAYGSLSQCIAAIGPGICSNCFEVGEEVINEFLAKFPDETRQCIIRSNTRFFLDLKKFVINQLMTSGFTQNSIDILDFCTYCGHGNVSFFSYRKEKNITARQWSIIMVQ